MTKPRSKLTIDYCGRQPPFVRNLVVLLAASFLLLGLLGGCVRRTPHQRLKWKVEDFFKDRGVVSLCKAIEAKNLKEIDRLVKSGVDVNAKGRGNMTPLLWAFPMGEEVFKKVLDLGADPNVVLTENYLLLKGKSVVFATVELADGPMHYEYFRDVPMKNYLGMVLDHGGDPNAQDPAKQTPLFFIAHRSRKLEEKMIRLLLAAGANINHRDGEE
jgi:ankyrin repeat protein